MKIIVCGSMKVSKKMVEVKDGLVGHGHEVLLPKHAEKYANGEKQEENSSESIKNKIEGDLIKDYYREIQKGDALLVINEEINGVKGYVGGSTFLEMGFAHVLDKKIFLLNEIPKMGYTDEIVAMQPVVLNRDLKNIQ